MNIHLFAYNLLVSGLALLALPVAWAFEKKAGRKDVLAQRLGYHPSCRQSVTRGSPRIWIHAVSVGEVKAVEAIADDLASLKTKVSMLVTTTTSTGQHFAHKLFSNTATVRYAPFDLWCATHRFFNTYHPDLLVVMETEIWPNWITIARQLEIPIVFLNGRISPRSIRSYLKIRPLIKPLLEHVHTFSMISKSDARRIQQLGAPAQRVKINGNVKMDVQTESSNGSMAEGLRHLFALDTQTPVFIAGSIRGPELDALIDVCERLMKKLPELVVIMAPRHIQNSDKIAERVNKKNIKWQFRSRLHEKANRRSAPFVILDTIGELRHIYSIASVVFCGASLVPLGGQNILEAAVWAKPVLFGPYMDDFEDARVLLERCGGGISVRDGAELTDRAMHLLTHPDEADCLGRLARRAVLANHGAARRHAQVVVDLLSELHPQANRFSAR